MGYSVSFIVGIKTMMATIIVIMVVGASASPSTCIDNSTDYSLHSPPKSLLNPTRCPMKHQHRHKDDQRVENGQCCYCGATYYPIRITEERAVQINNVIAGLVYVTDPFALINVKTDPSDAMFSSIVKVFDESNKRIMTFRQGSFSTLTFRQGSNSTSTPPLQDTYSNFIEREAQWIGVWVLAKGHTTFVDVTGVELTDFIEKRPECSICHEPMSDVPVVIVQEGGRFVQPCRHAFHRHCVDTRIMDMNDPICPLCHDRVPIQLVERNFSVEISKEKAKDINNVIQGHVNLTDPFTPIAVKTSGLNPEFKCKVKVFDDAENLIMVFQQGLLPTSTPNRLNHISTPPLVETPGHLEEKKQKLKVSVIASGYDIIPYRFGVTGVELSDVIVPQQLVPQPWWSSFVPRRFRA